jgi:ketosteroid isomerase-like protein
MSKLQKALQSREETLESLKSKYGIKAKSHSIYPNLVQLKYSQFDSPMAEPLVQESRGIILDTENNFNVVARPFDKFFNCDEPNAATIDWSTASVQKKEDGSLTILYYYDNQWLVATSGTPDAGGTVNDTGLLFRDLFWRTWITEMQYSTNSLNEKFTYMFELTTPDNRVVVYHPKYKLSLIGVRETLTGTERPLNDFRSGARLFWRTQTFSLKSMEDVRKSFEGFSGLDQEGYVIVDAQFNRVKVKHPGYVTAHHMLGGFNDKYMLDIIRSGESPEILAYFPELQVKIQEFTFKYLNLIEKAEKAYAEIPFTENQKEFAVYALKHSFSAALFMFRAGRIKSIKEYFQTLRIESLLDMVNS